MIRRSFLGSAGSFLLGILGQGTALGRAGRAGGASPTPGRKTVTLFFGGDVMTGRGIDQILPHPSDPEIHEVSSNSALDYVELAERMNGPIPRPVGFDYVWGDALEVLDAVQPDARIVNLETSVTTHDQPWPKKGIQYRMHPGNVPCLVAAGIDACALANNHVLDWSVEGLRETLASLHSHGILTAGAGEDLSEAMRPAIIEPEGGPGIVLYSIAKRDSGLPASWTATESSPGVFGFRRVISTKAAALIRDVQERKQQGEIVVVSIHWGGNWGYAVDREHTQFARMLIDAGADVIHGHSAHHVRGIEVYRERPVIYGSGEMLDDYEGIDKGNSRYRGDLALMYFVTLDAGNGELRGLEMQPMRIRRFRLNHASREETEWLVTTLSREGRRFNTAVHLADNGRLELTWQRKGTSL